VSLRRPAVWGVLAASAAAAALSCTGPNPAYWVRSIDSDAATTPTDFGAPADDARSFRDAEPPNDGAADRPVAPPDLAPVDMGGNPPSDVAFDRSAGEPVAETAPPPPPPPPDAAPDVIAADPRPTKDLIGSWPFNQGPASGNTITDGAGNSAALTSITFGGTASPAVPAGQAMQFDGSKSLVNLTMTPILKADGNKTIALWFRTLTTTATLSNMVTIFNSKQVLNVGVQLGFNGTKLAAWRFGQATSEMVAPNGVDQSWHHAAYTYEAGKHLIYLDGAQVGQLTATMPTGDLNQVMLGTYQSGQEMFKGSMNDVRFYSRALSAAEVLTLAKPN
jgi:hypothetical protein